MPTTAASALGHPAAGALLLTALVVAVYGYGAATNGFAVDDSRFILENPFVSGEGEWWRAFVDPMTVDARDDGGIVRPLRTLEYRFDRALGAGAAIFHWHSVVWHALACVLVLSLLRRLLGDARAALAGAAVWALHPMHVEPVAAIGFRADVAMGAFAAATLYCALRSNGRDRWLAFALAGAVLAMLWKETAIVLPLLVFAVLLVRPRDGRRPLASAARAALPYVAVAVLYAVYRFGLIEGADSHVGYRIGGGVAGVFATMFKGFGAYLTFAALPVAPAYDWYLPVSRTLADPVALAWLAVHLGVVAGAAVLYRRGRCVPLAGVLLFYGALLPVANWPFDLGIPTTERFLYVPLVGLVLLVGAGVARVGSRAALAAVWMAALAMGAIAAQRVPDWRDDATIYTETLEQHDSVRAHTWAGNQQRERGWALRRRAREADDAAEAEAWRHMSVVAFNGALWHLDAAIEGWKRQIDPWPPQYHVASVPLVNASNVAIALGRHEDALAYANEALAIRPDSGEGHYNRAWSLLRLRRPGEAAAAMHAADRAGMELDEGESFRFFAQVGRALQAEGDREQARRAYERALEITPDGVGADRVRGFLRSLE